MQINAIPSLNFQLERPEVVYYNPPVWNWTASTPNYMNLWISLAGRGRIRINGQNFLFEPGFAVLLFPGDNVSAQKNDTGPQINVGLHLYPPPSVMTDFHFTRMREKPITLRNVATAREMARYIEYLGGLHPPVSPGELNLWARQLLMVFCRDWELGPEDPLDRIIRQQVEAIKEDPKKDWSLADFARKASLSNSQYFRRFTKLMGIAPNAFMIQRRIETACLLLHDSTMTIDQIADALGYRDVAFFSRQFKAKMGCPPSLYRGGKRGRAARGGDS
jgi:AraC-like DNA-binding protein